MDVETDRRDVPATVPLIKRALPHWLLEGLFIVISVALGFAVAQYSEQRNNRALAARVLSSIQAEIESNLAVLEPLAPIHSKWADVLNSVDTSNSAQSGLDLFFATRPPLPPKSSPFPVLRRSAWDAAISSGAIRLIDYNVAEALSEIYGIQEIATGNVDRLANGALSSPAVFDPAARAVAVRMLWITLEDIDTSEAMLLELYRRHLPRIRAAAAAQQSASVQRLNGTMAACRINDSDDVSARRLERSRYSNDATMLTML